MNSVRNLRSSLVQRQLSLLMPLTCSTVLLLADAAFLWFQIFQFCKSLAADITSLADMAGASRAEAVIFNDPTAAAETLARLKAKDHILNAPLILPDGNGIDAGSDTPQPSMLSLRLALQQQHARHSHLRCRMASRERDEKFTQTGLSTLKHDIPGCNTSQRPVQTPASAMYRPSCSSGCRRELTGNPVRPSGTRFTGMQRLRTASVLSAGFHLLNSNSRPRNFTPFIDLFQAHSTNNELFRTDCSIPIRNFFSKIGREENFLSSHPPL